MANAYTEVQINLTTSFANADDYVAFASLVVWADPSNFSVIVRNKGQSLFTLRIWNGYSQAIDTNIEWMVMHI